MKNIILNIANIFTKIFEKLETKKLDIVHWFIFIFIFSYIRGFLENIAVGSNYISQKYFLFFFLHIPIFYIIAFLSFSLVGHIITGEKIEKISKASLGLLPIILLAPIFDFLVFQGDYTMSKYVDPPWNETLGIGSFSLFFLKYSLFGPMGFLNFGNLFFKNEVALFENNYLVNYGLKIEVIIILIFFSFYILLKTKNIWKVWLALFLSQAMLFLIGYMPYIITNFLILPNTTFSLHNISKLNPQEEWDYAILSFCLITLIPIFIIWGFFYDKKRLFSFFKNLRIPRLGMYVASFWYGVYIAKIPFHFNFFDWLILILANLAIIISWMFAVGSNDIADEKCDKTSNPNRPLVSGAISKEEAKSINIFLRIVSYICAFLAGYAFFITIFIRSCISYLYSNEPFRLKKYPIISTFCLSSSVLLGIIGGYLILSSNSIYDFPGKLVFLILIVFTLSMNVIHIKDYEGDREDGVKTIPVIFGLQNGKIIVGVMSAFSFIFPPLLYQEHFDVLIIPSLACAVIAFFLIKRKNFQEWPVLLLYYVYTLPIMFYIY